MRARAPNGRASSAREMLAVGAVLCLVAGLEFGRHIADGGFYTDDWWNAADYAFAKSPRVLSFAEHLWSGQGGRWGLALALPVPHSLFGPDMAAHLALAVALGVVTVLAYYALLRRLGIAPIHAIPIAALVLIFPWADSVRLWPTGSINAVAVPIFFLSTLLAVHGLRVPGRRGLALHVLAQAGYVASVATYEAALPVIALSGLLYVRVAPRRDVAIRRWKADLVLALALLLAAALYTNRPAPSIRAFVVSVAKFLGGGPALLGKASLPIGLPAVAAAAAAVGLVALAIRWRRWAPAGDATGRPSWMGVALVAAAYAIAGHLMFVGTGLHPTASGIENRGNVISAYAYVPLAYAVLMLLAMRLEAARRRQAATAVAISLFLATGYTVQLQHDVSRWDRATVLQRRALSRAESALTVKPAPGSSVYSFGWPGRASAGIPIFAETWDLAGALRLHFRESRLAAFPIYSDAHIVCARRRLYPVASSSSPRGPDGGYGRGEGQRYGRAWFVDIAHGRSWRVDDRSECSSLARTLKPGPAYSFR